MIDEAELFASRINVSRETLGKLETYAGLLAKWNPRINLVAPSTLAEVWQRHFLDSAQIANLPSAPCANWLDIGSGGGLPGLVVALLRAEQQQGFRMTLVESDQRKCVFLRTVSRELELNVTVKNLRIEQLPPQKAEVISARALAPLPKLLEYAHPHLVDGGECLFLKGKTAKDEIAEARKTWNFLLDEHNSITDPHSTILRIKEISRV